MNLYSKLEKHLPREKEETQTQDWITFNRHKGYNACKAQYDEVLRRVVVDEGEVLRLLLKLDANSGYDELSNGYQKHLEKISQTHQIFLKWITKKGMGYERISKNNRR